MSSMPSSEARVLIAPETEADTFLPEGPRSFAIGGREALVWVNIQTAVDAVRGTLHVAYWEGGERRRYALPARVGFVFPTDVPDTVLLGMEKAIGTLNIKTGNWTPFAKIPDTDPRTIINDGEIVPGGKAIVFGTKDVHFQDKIAHLYLFTLADNRLSILADGQTCSNGKLFADGGTTLFDIDTPTKTVAKYRFDLQARTLALTGTAIDLRHEDAFPDGMCDCGDGTAIVAFYNPHRGGAGKAVRYDLSTGKAIEEWTMPGSPRVTCPLLVNVKGKIKLVLTTCMEGMPEEMRKASPNAGSAFIGDTALTALPTLEIVRI